MQPIHVVGFIYKGVLTATLHFADGTTKKGNALFGDFASLTKWAKKNWPEVPLTIELN
jgi:hypothetical protein